jgi:glycosyltransferase involved in cell wall biosynthesis
VHVVVPDGIDDPARPSGGNTYDRRLCDALTAGGRSVAVHAVPGAWPRPDGAAYAALADVVESIPDGDAVVLDGLVASTAPKVLVPQAPRLRLIALVHMPLGPAGGDDALGREAAVLTAASEVVVTSDWARLLLLRTYVLPGERVHVAQPGVDPAEPAPGTEAGGRLLCVAAVIPGKGHDLLLDALAGVSDLPWDCTCVGSLEREPGFAAAVRRQAADLALDERVRFTGPLVEADLDRSYAAADLLVLPSRAETYGMVITEALARGLPVVAADVGGVPQALGHGADGERPGMLAPPGDVAALEGALRRWLEDAPLRRRLRRAASERRESLPTWSDAAAVFAGRAA